MATELDCYELIGVPRTAKFAEIRDAYYAAINKTHPDKGGRDDAAYDNRMRDSIHLNAAWSILRDPDRRAAYDAELRLADARAAGAKVDAQPASGASSPSPAAAPPQVRPAAQTTASDEIADIMAERDRALAELRRQQRVERDAKRCRKEHRYPLELRADDDLATKFRSIARWLRLDRIGQRIVLVGAALVIFLVIPTVGQMSITGGLVAIQLASLGGFAVAQSIAALRVCHTPLGDAGLAAVLSR